MFVLNFLITIILYDYGQSYHKLMITYKLYFSVWPMGNIYDLQIYFYYPGYLKNDTFIPLSLGLYTSSYLFWPSMTLYNLKILT